MNCCAIRTEKLTRDFGRLRALSSLTIEIPKGRVLALLGPNGAGKTTFLKLLMGLIEPTAGCAQVLGLPSRIQTAELTTKIASMGEGHEPPQWATPKALEALQAGASPKFSKSFFRDFCSKKGLSLRKPYSTLSKGQKRWVLAGLTFAAGAEVLLMDEPADGLDPSARLALYDYLRDYVSSAEATAVVATHIINDIERVADEVAIIDAGQLVLYAPLEDLREQVRQVEIPGASTMPEIGLEVNLLGSIQLGDALIGWIKSDSLSDDQLRQCIGSASTIRPVNLETLYLAVAEHRVSRDQNSMREVD